MSILTACYFYQIIYIFIPWFKKDKPHKEEVPHRFAVLCAARNERFVIGHLINSIRAQTYDSNLIDIFVVADNCTDDTAEIARKAGAIVYERHNTELKGKGYALDFLISKINSEHDASQYDAYIVFDADNILDVNFISEMNKTFSDGYNIITSFRNSKNYGTNWISSGYALWFIRESMYLNHPRMLIGSSCAISGTGFLVKREIIEKYGGWKFFLLTEDIQFTVKNIIDGEKIGYCKNAVLFDEQPVTFKQSWSQRLRWSRGYIQVALKYGAALLKGTFVKFDYSCYDMTMNIMPLSIIGITSIVTNIIGLILIAIMSPENLVPAAWIVGKMIFGLYMSFFVFGFITMVTAWKKIYCNPVRKIFSLFTFPLFMFTYMPIIVASLFKKVEWKQIDHTASMTLDDIRSHKK